MATGSATRRDVLGFGLTSLTAISLPEWLIREAGAQTSPRIRHEASTPGGQKMLRLYRNAVQRMQALPHYDPLSWRFQANIHRYPQNEPIDRIFDPAQSSDPVARRNITSYRTLAMGGEGQASRGIWNTCTHGVPHFLTWHRMYLLFFERIVEAVIGEPFGLPYWDYTVSNKRILPLAFREAVDGSQAKNPLWFPERHPGINTLASTEGLTDADVATEDLFMQSSLFGDSNGIGFSTVMEGTPHGSVHVGIGTTYGMGRTLYAARDPIFWLHHATIDRLWESWRQPLSSTGTSKRDRSDVDDDADLEWRQQRYAFASPQKERVVVVAAEVLRSTTSLGYQYDTLVPVGALVAQADKPNPFSAAAASRVIAERGNSIQPALRIGSGALSNTTLVATVSAFGMAPLQSGQVSRYILLLDGIRSDEAPVSSFDVYINLRDGQAEDERRRRLVGSFNLFGAENDHQHGMHSAPPGRLYAYDITALVSARLINPADLSDITISVLPRGMSFSQTVTVERISLIAR